MSDSKSNKKTKVYEKKIKKKEKKKKRKSDSEVSENNDSSLRSLLNPKEGESCSSFFPEKKSKKSKKEKKKKQKSNKSDSEEGLKKEKSKKSKKEKKKRKKTNTSSESVSVDIYNGKNNQTDNKSNSKNDNEKNNKIISLQNNSNLLVTNSKEKINKGPKILVLGGGSMRGIAHVGALEYLREKGILNKIKVFAGTSIGAFICLLLVLGYTPKEMFEFIKKFKFEKLKNSEPMRVFTSFGTDKGERVEFMIKSFIKRKTNNENITLKQLYEITKRNLIVSVTCLTKDRICYFNHKNQPDLQVHLAVRMSMCIPLMYVPITYKGLLYLDGGCKDNFPIGIFRNKIDRVIGICLKSETKENDEISSFEDYLMKLIFCIINNAAKESAQYKKHTITITIKNNIGVFDFDISEKQKTGLFNTGYLSAQEKYES